MTECFFFIILFKKTDVTVFVRTVHERHSQQKMRIILTITTKKTHKPLVKMSIIKVNILVTDCTCVLLLFLIEVCTHDDAACVCTCCTDASVGLRTCERMALMMHAFAEGLARCVPSSGSPV